MAQEKRVHLVAGILRRPEGYLLVSSRYPNHASPLWNLPGGRTRPGELATAALIREFAEETGLAIAVHELRYVSESFDPGTGTHFLCLVFAVSAIGEPFVPEGDAHVVGLAWVPDSELAARLTTAAVREPLLAHLADSGRRYFGFLDAGITIEFADPA